MPKTNLAQLMSPKFILKAVRQRVRRRAKDREFRMRKAFYTKFIGREDVCFDIGANVGNRTEIFAELGRLVVAVEPQSGCNEVLVKRFGANERVRVEAVALGPEEGKAEMWQCDASQLSSLDRDWVESVKRSGRFAEHRWDKAVTVPMMTLDHLIAKYGDPSFVKIDVEGFEARVLEGLSRPVRALSFEFTPERMKEAGACLERLSSLGSIECNFSVGETLKLEFARWMEPSQLLDYLRQFEGNNEMFGDVYVRSVIRPKH
jgi:FkbM family methyltransferase